MTTCAVATAQPAAVRLEAGAPLVYVHMPKAAGTTLRHILQQRVAPEGVCPAELQDQLADLSPADLQRYRLFAGHYFYRAMQRLLGPRAVYVTLLRDPIERALSNYAYLQNRPNQPVNMWATGLDLEAFVFHPRAIATIANRQTRMLAADLAATDAGQLSTSLQREWQDALMGKYPSAREAQQALDELAYFGLAERFDDSLALLAHTLGWPELPHGYSSLNVSPRRPARTGLPRHLLERLIELNAEDLALYDYARGVFAERYRRLRRTTA